MGIALRLLLIAGCEDDIQPVLRELRRSDFEPIWERVETAETMRGALQQKTWDVILADDALPNFDGLAALRLVRESGQDVPFLLISGAIGEETAVAAMRAGAHDYVMKDRLSRLPAAVERELREAERRRAHRAAVAELRHSKETFELVVRGSADGIWDWNIVTNGDYFSERWYQMLGYDTGELSPSFETWVSHLHPEEREWVFERVRQHLEERVPYDIEYRLRTKSGPYRWFRASGQAVWDETGKPLRMAGSITDITERKQAEEDLRQKNADLRGVLEAFPDLYFWLDPDGTIRRYHAGMPTYVPPEQFLNRRMQDVLPPAVAEQIQRAMTRALATEEVVEIEYPLPMSDGEHWFDARVLGLLKQHVLIVVRDISKRKRAEEELRRAKEAAEEASCAKSEFLANISHEFRTPLNAILGLTRLVLETELRQDQREDLLIVQAAGESLLGLITDLLDFSRIEARKLELRPREFTLKACLSQALELLRPLAEAKGLPLICDVRPDVPQRLIGDPERLNQVLVNLLGNAIKFTESGGVSVRVAVEAQTPDAVRLHFAVADTGIGIPAEKRQAIFEPFTQADGSLTRKYGGTGLGLSITARLVQMMRGAIRVESEVGRGSTFHVIAAFDLPPAARAGAKAEIVLAAAQRARSLHVLVAEDNFFNQKLMANLLTRNGHRVEMAEDGQKALDLLERHGFDLVLMDVQMPILDGMEATRQIRQREAGTGRHLPILALTAHAQASDRVRCLEAGMDGFLTKPFQEELLWRMIAALVPESPTEQPIMDPAAFLERLGGNRAAMQDLIQVFLEDTPKLEQGMAAALAAGDAPGLQRAAHSLKGMLGFLGAAEAHAAAVSLDQLSKAKDLAVAGPVHHQLQQELDRLRPVLEELARQPQLV